MMHKLKKFSTKHKNNRVWYYFKNFVRQIFPRTIYTSKLNKILDSIKEYDHDYIRKRLNYYNKLDEIVILSDNVESLKEFKPKKKNKTYFFDTFEYSRYFQQNYRMGYKFGDVTFVPDEPSIVKSRPINGNNKNSVILNLNKARHFTFVKDKRDFRKKKNMIVGRNYGKQPQRIKFLEMYINHPMCNVGKVDSHPEYLHLKKEILTYEDQLDYKFILCIEGNDVATNLKWVMSSQSLAVMPTPKYETWFLEGTLIPNYHFVLIKDDYSDLEERMNFYISNPDEALRIISNANEYVKQFRDQKAEDLLSLLVLEKYFYKTGQKELGKDLKLLLASNG